MDLSAKTDDQLQRLASWYGVKKRTSLSREELIQALDKKMRKQMSLEVSNKNWRDIDWTFVPLDILQEWGYYLQLDRASVKKKETLEQDFAQLVKSRRFFSSEVAVFLDYALELTRRSAQGASQSST